MTIGLPDPDWYLDDVLAFAEPGGKAIVHEPVTAGPAHDWRDWWRSRATVSEFSRCAAQHGFVLAPAELAALGVTRSRARNEVRQGRWTAAGFGMTAPVDVREPETEYGAALRIARRRHALMSAGAARRRPSAVASARSSAILYGLPTMRIPRAPELTQQAIGLGSRGTAHLFGATIDTPEISEWFGISLESVARTLVSLARHGRRDALMAADAALREGLVDRAGIATALRTAVGWPWVRQARAILALADPRAESPLESITRLALHDDGFPAPDLQAWLGIDRVDFYWAEYGLVLEADGRVKYGDERWEEKRREQRLRNHVRQIERVVWSEIVDTWPMTRNRLRRAFR